MFNFHFVLVLFVYLQDLDILVQNTEVTWNLELWILEYGYGIIENIELLKMLSIRC